MLQYLKVCAKKVRTKDGHTFDAMFAYRQADNNGTMSDVLSPSTDKDGNPTMVARSIRIALTGEAKKKLIAEGKFPYLLTLEDGLSSERGANGSHVLNGSTPDFYLTWDKDKDGVLRLDKNGKKHRIAVISDYRSALHVEPLNTMTLDDIDEFE